MKRTIAPTLCLAACTPKGTDTAVATPYTWPGGSFTLTTTDVDDGCAGGTFGVSGSSEDEGNPGEWPSPIEIPAWELLEAGAICRDRGIGSSTAGVRQAAPRSRPTRAPVRSASWSVRPTEAAKACRRRRSCIQT